MPKIRRKWEIQKQKAKKVNGKWQKRKRAHRGNPPMGHRFTHTQTVFNNYPSPSPLRLKVPVNRGLQAFPGGTEGFWRFTSLSQNLHLTFTRSWWKIGERYVKANSGCGLVEMPLYRAFALMLVKVKDTFRKVPARTVHPRAYIIYA